MMAILLRRGIIPPAGGIWIPLELGANLIAWYKATDGVYVDAGTTLATNGQTVQQWNDKSGNGYNLSQATAGKRPTFNTGGFNGRPSVTFNAGADTYMKTGTDAVVMGTGTVGSAFVVGQMATGTETNGRLLCYLATGETDELNANGNSAAYLMRDTANNGFKVGRDAALKAPSAISLDTNYRLGCVFDGANVTTYANNTVGASAADTNAWASPGTIFVGVDASVGTFGAWSGPISEIVITNSALDATQRLNLDNYFKSEWGL